MRKNQTDEVTDSASSGGAPAGRSSMNKHRLVRPAMLLCAVVIFSTAAWYWLYRADRPSAYPVLPVQETDALTIAPPAVLAARESPTSGRSRPDPASLAQMTEYLDVMSGEFENRKDVKCWTSFKQLETFVAGCQLSPPSTHLKTQVVLNYLDRVWRTAAADQPNPTPIAEETFNRVARQMFPSETVEFLEYRLKLNQGTITIPYHDVDNFQGTVEPIRLLQTLTAQTRQRDPDRSPLSAAAIASARQLAAVLSTAVLKEANVAARENRHTQIQDEDVLSADNKIATGLAMVPYDPNRQPSTSLPPPVVQEDASETMLTIIRKKISSLGTFNTTYSQQKLGKKFDADFSEHVSEWATWPVASEATKAHADILVELTSSLYAECARQHPNDQVLTGPLVLETILAAYPFVTSLEGVINLFPEEDSMCNYWVPEFQADAFRDSAGHWRALQQTVEVQRKKPALPPMDLYAMEELTEFTSIYAIALYAVAGEVARRSDQPQVTDRELSTAHHHFELLSDQYYASTKTQTKDSVDATDPSLANWKSWAKQARQDLEQVYIAEIFSDQTSSSGIDFQHATSDMVVDYRFSHDVDQPINRYLELSQRFLSEHEYDISVPILEIGIAGGGVAVGDADGDGRQDIYLVSGKKDRLFRNLGGLRFVDITDASGLNNTGEGRAAYFVDYDNDGDQDLFVTHVYSPNRLLKNKGDGKFEDVTQQAGLPSRTDLISHSATWFDFDNDGFLDVYIVNFGNWLAGDRPVIASSSRNAQPNQLFRNQGDGKFEDITSQTRAGDVGWAHAVSHFDANGDGWQDVYLANDFGEDILLTNVAGRKFQVSTPSCLKNRFLHGMSVGFTDINKDEIEDIYVSNIAMFSFVSKYIKPDSKTEVVLSRRTTTNARMTENNIFLVSNSGRFDEKHDQHFDRSAQGCGWAWDADFFDFDNDGQEDLYVVNGREPNLSYDRERNVLFKQWQGRFYDVSGTSGADFAANSRGAAFADFDHDGDLDIIVNNYQDGAVLLRNNLQRNNWIRFRLQGTVSNRDAVGARVSLTSGGSVQTRCIHGGSGFLSAEPKLLHFGLKMADNVENVVVAWPSGRRQSISNLAANQEYLIEEPRDDGRVGS